MLAVQVKGGRPGRGSDGGTPRFWIIANAKGLCIDGSQLNHAKTDERGAMSAGRLLTAVKADEYPPAIWSRSIPLTARPDDARQASERKRMMAIIDEFQERKSELRLASLYQWFERAVVLFLTFLIAIVVVAAVWTLSLKILFGLVLAGGLDPSDFSVFQAVFGMIFTVIIALEFKKSLLVVAERREAVVQIRSVIVIALLAICRKIIILDLKETDALHTVALATVILALGVVYWLIRDSDCRQEAA